jgi:hypothetical protein
MRYQRNEFLKLNSEGVILSELRTHEGLTERELAWNLRVHRPDMNKRLNSPQKQGRIQRKDFPFHHYLNDEYFRIGRISRTDSSLQDFSNDVIKSGKSHAISRLLMGKASTKRETNRTEY